MSLAHADAPCLIADRGELDFFHSATITTDSVQTAFDAYCVMTADIPALLQLAFWLRDRVSGAFGVKGIGGFEKRRSVLAPKVGEMLDFFSVEENSPGRLVLTSRDRHLAVMVCLDLQVRGNTKFSKCLRVTASVVTHNRFGRLYMLPVAPAHRLIISWMLKKFI
jgi:hypothetical protein